MHARRTFNNSKGFQAQADVSINSPTQTNNQNVNVIVRTSDGLVSPSALTKDRAFKIVTNSHDVAEETTLKPNTEFKERDIKLDEGLDDGLEGHLKERSIESAKTDLEEMQAIITDKDHLIEALALIIDLYQNNPLIVNKFIIPNEEELMRLLFLLTGAEQIEIIKYDPDVTCLGKVSKFIRIQKIMIKKNDNTYNFKYSFPNVIQLLDNRNISWKYIC